ncbi:MAG: 1-aminocyclopropane-1-carboxylate deaminase/D-cysteine desulfhydrase [Gammaproteobacteria bacterium]
MNTTLNTLLAEFSRTRLAQLPSPVFPATQNLAQPDNSELENIYIKHDGVCSLQYAGNKVRKLEFLLAEAQERGARHIVTLGAAGSNHAVATSTYAKQLGMRCTVCMGHQPPSEIATLNLRRHVALGTDLRVFECFGRAVACANELATQDDTYLVPLGGSDPLASLGYIVAIAELAEQIDQGLLPCPKRIYVACGTMGTAVGCALGVALLNLPIQVVAVRVTESSVASQSLFDGLYRDSVDLITSKLPGFPVSRSIKPGQVLFVDDFFGEEYAKPTSEALAAIDIAKAAGITLEGTYTGKAFAAMLEHKRRGFSGPLLFWLTLNAIETPLVDLHELDALGKDFEPYR